MESYSKPIAVKWKWAKIPRKHVVRKLRLLPYLAGLFKASTT